MLRIDVITYFVLSICLKLGFSCMPGGIGVSYNYDSNSYPQDSTCARLGCISGYECTYTGNCVLTKTKALSASNAKEYNNMFERVNEPSNSKIPMVNQKVLIPIPEDIKAGQEKMVPMNQPEHRVPPLDKTRFFGRNYRPAPFITPDFIFKQCCIDRNIPDSCRRKCTYQTYTKEAVLQMYFGKDDCPISYARELHFCAAQGQDHTECCRSNSVASTVAQDKCLVFCDQRPGKITNLDISYIHCFTQFENIKQCFSQRKRNQTK